MLGDFSPISAPRKGWILCFLVAMRVLNTVIWWCKFWSLASVFSLCAFRIVWEISWWSASCISLTATQWEHYRFGVGPKLLLQRPICRLVLWLFTNVSSLMALHLNCTFVLKWVTISSVLFLHLVLNLYHLHTMHSCLGYCLVLVILKEGRK